MITMRPATTVVVLALPQVQEEDMTKYLFSANDETTYPVQEYLIHLAPEEDYKRDRDRTTTKGQQTQSQQQQQQLVPKHSHDHVQPYFLRPDHDDINLLSKPRVVNFYSPFCGHCQKFRPKYIALARSVNERAVVATVESSAQLSKHLLNSEKKASEKTKKQTQQQVTVKFGGNSENTDDDTFDIPVLFYAVSCAEFHKVCRDNNIKGYPTVKVYKPRSLDGIVLNKLTPEGVAESLGIHLRDVNKQQQELDFHELHQKLEEDSFDILEQLGRNRDHDALGMAYTLQRHTQKDTFFDAALSFSHELKHSIYPTGIRDGTRLSDGRKEAFKEWIDLLYWTLPPTWRVHIILHDLRSHFDHYTSSRTFLLEVTDRHHNTIHEREENTKWTKSCRKPTQRGTIGQQKYKEWLLGTTDTAKVRENASENGHLCGLWNLLHIISVGVSERQKAVLGDRTRISTAHAARTIRNYIENFLSSCSVCQQTFLQTYDSCGLNICKRLRQPKHHTTHKNNHPRAISHDSWHELALWIWELHNEVNVRLLREEYSARASAAGILSSHAISPVVPREEPTIEEENAVRWPSNTDCPQCWLMSSSSSKTASSSKDASKSHKKSVDKPVASRISPPYNKTAVYDYLRQHYWPNGPQHFRFIVLDKTLESPTKVHKLTLKEEIHLFVTTQPNKVIAVLLVLVLVHNLYQNWKKSITGYHKKYETPSPSYCDDLK